MRSYSALRKLVSKKEYSAYSKQSKAGYTGREALQASRLHVLFLVVVEQAAPGPVLGLLLLVGARRGPDGAEAETVVRPAFIILLTTSFPSHALALVAEASRVKHRGGPDIADGTPEALLALALTLALALAPRLVP